MLHDRGRRWINDIQYRLWIEAKEDQDRDNRRDGDFLPNIQILEPFVARLGFAMKRSLHREQDVERREDNSQGSKNRRDWITREGSDQDQEFTDEAGETRQRQRG